jgi:hypothetical protein
MEKDFWRALFSGWQGALSTTGSIVLMGIALWFWDRPVPRWITIAIAVACFVFASRRAWMIERTARVAAEIKIGELIKLSELKTRAKTPAEQHHYETAEACLAQFGEKAKLALRHLKRVGTVTVNSPGMPGATIQPLPPDGITTSELNWALGACAGAGVVVMRETNNATQRTYEIGSSMHGALDELLY